MIGLFGKSKNRKENLLDLGLTDNTIKLKDQETILKYLLPNEKVEATLSANLGERNKKSILVLTDKRVILIERGQILNTSNDFKAIEYPNISSVSYKEANKWGTPNKVGLKAGLDSLMGEISLTTSNADFSVKIFKKFAKQASDIITEHINDSRQNVSMASQYPNIDIADQIKKLAD